MNAHENIRNLSVALTNLVTEIESVQPIVSLPGARIINQAIEQAQAALRGHQDWMLGERR